MRGVGLAIGLMLAVAVMPSLCAQQATQGAATSEAEAHAPATGDKLMDARLVDMAEYARMYPDAFIDEIGRYLDVPRGYASALLTQQGWRAGDVWYACALGKVIGQPCRAVVRARSHSPETTWAEVAGVLDVALDRRQRQSLRALSERSYQHWARPLPKS